MEAQVAVLWREFESEEEAVVRLLSQGTTGREEGVEQRLEQGRLRGRDPLGPIVPANLIAERRVTR